MTHLSRKLSKIIPFASRPRLSPQLEQFFYTNPNFDPRQHKLIDTRPSHRWFDQLSRCVQAGTYIFQKIFEERQGPEAVIEGRLSKIFSSYDYLGLIGHPEIDCAAIDAVKRFGTGTGGVRLLTGTNQLHDELEYELSLFKGTESALALSSGYLANLTAIASLLDKRDVVIADEYIHRSLVDAIRLADVPLKTFKHNDVESLRDVIQKNVETGRRVLIVVEGIYSMDGDISPLPAIVELKEEFGALLLVDEAHSLGVLGKNGRGITEHFDMDPSRIDIFTGSLSKAIPSNGGFIAARQQVIHFLKHGGAPFMFSAALSPPNTAAALTAIQVIRKETWRMAALWKNTRILLNGLKNLQVDVGKSESPVIPILCGSNENAFALSKHLYDAGYLATSVIYPAVPQGMARLRLCATAAMQADVVLDFIDELKQYMTTRRYD
jgi:8-amino-7-oxononanoate synthase